MKRFLIIAGEPSGDARGAELVQAMKELDPLLLFYGAGGSKMRQAGVLVWHDLVQHAFVGFTDVARNYSYFKRIFNSLINSLFKDRPDGIILVDYPGFNLRFARVAKEEWGQAPIFYYISPQIWAWGRRRIKLIRDVVDHMIVVFRFEEELYRKAGVPVTFVGHPFLDAVKPTMSCQEALQQLGLAKEKTTIALLPGSRIAEVERHLPVMLEAAEILLGEFPNLQFVVAKTPTLPGGIYDRVKKDSLPLRIVSGLTYDLLHVADAAIVSSGSATLETALMNVPMVVIYKASWLNYLLGKIVVKIPNIALVNVVAGKRIVPELIQHRATGPAIAKALRPMIGPVEMAEFVRGELKNVREKLGSPGAVKRTAEKILREIKTSG